MDAVLLVTTRPQGYNHALSPDYYRHLELIPLPPELALDYGTRLTRNRHAGDGERTEKIIERLKEASLLEATSRLMESPLQVTIMAFLVNAIRAAPRRALGFVPSVLRTCLPQGDRA